MTRSTPGRVNDAAARELRSLASRFSLIRILKYTAGTPIDTPRLHERLSAKASTLDPASLNRTLLRLRRRGWLRNKNSNWSLTPEGRKALALARAGLKDLSHLTHG